MPGTGTAQARAYLRTVQHLAGPVSYSRIVEAMRRVEGHDPQRVADLLRPHPVTNPSDTVHTNE